MSDRVHFDLAEVRVMQDAINRASRVAPAEQLAVLNKGALNIKNDARKRVSGLKHAPAYPSSITYDVYQSLTGPTAIIGPDKNRRQGALGNLLEYGSVKNAPRPHIGPAADAEEPRFARAVEELAVKALGL